MRGQTVATTEPASLEPAEDSSIYLGRPVLRPESLSGLWETSNAHGGAVGIHVRLETTVPSEASTFRGTTQAWLHLEVGLYERAGAVLKFGEENYFSDTPRFGIVHYEDNRLTVHWQGYDLDLHRLPGDRWSGRLHRNKYDAQVVLTRPQVASLSRKPWFVGTWQSLPTPNFTCIHIAEQASGEYVGWSDSLILWGAARFAPQVHRPPYALELYAERAKIELAEDGATIKGELFAYTAACCSHHFIGRSSENGAAMAVDWPSGPNQAPQTAVWRKMPGDSCLESNPMM